MKHDDEFGALVGEPEEVLRIFESMPVMLAGLAGPRHRFAAVNRAYRETFERAGYVGRPWGEVFPEAAGRQLTEMMDRVYETGVAQARDGWRVQVANPSGGRVEERCLDVVVVPRRDIAGALTGVNVVTVDSAGRSPHPRDVTVALQRQLLPPGLPVLPSVRIAGSYLAGGTEDAAGGDWFDAVPAPGGQVVLVAGDVAGHGVPATAAMGQLRAVLRERLDATGDILAAVAAADRTAPGVPGGPATTVCVTLLDPADGTLTYCCAGHPPPLITGAAGTRFLALTGHGPLGTGSAFGVRRDRLEPGELVLLYTDGIIDRPGRTPAAATVELASVVHGATAEQATTRPLELLAGRTGHTDDIVLLAAQRIVPVPPLHLRLPCESAAIRQTRAALGRWLDRHQAGDEDRSALAHAVGELVTNAVEHAHPDRPGGTVTVTAELRDDGEARITVADDGRWRERTRPGDAGFRRDHGLGLLLAAAFADHLDVGHGVHGTTATIRRRMSRPARLLTAEPGGGDGCPAPETMLIVDQPRAPGNRVAIHGPLDTGTAARLARELDELTLGGTCELVADLSAVTQLASAAVAVLFDRPALRLFAPPGSVAHHVLETVHLPHSTTDPHPSGAA
ncbi:SpoIIE family protein phosphatase [Actinoplanes siamensis]|uniref:STAS domain-containing protein n=1 Tax=Actinoplanes siamensis TaxID=1223317 RepID=A0A919TL94_9ACTN|nr:SpoIIE family protein phosphatase [Actinoplanes siamensis]GIF06921.1 hypothetical protein Asi03nite_44590 [Actinoplanes siamensis]